MIRNPRILTMYERRARARGLTLDEWFAVIEREHQEQQDRAAVIHSRSRQFAALARKAMAHGRTWVLLQRRTEAARPPAGAQ